MVSTRIKFTLKIIVALLSASIFILGGIWFYEEFQASQYQSEVPFELQLKVPPEEILYSEAYKNRMGRNEIKYAYLAGEVSPILDEDVARRTPTSQTVVLETFKDEAGKTLEKLKTTFTTDPQFYNDGDAWKQIEYATTTQEVFSMSGAIPNIKRREFSERFFHHLFGVKPVFALTSTFYPNPDAETTSVDGYVFSEDIVSIGIGSWSGARTAADGTSATDAGLFLVVEVYFYWSGTRGDLGNAGLNRTFLLFDTAALTSNAVISAATLSVNLNGRVNGDNDGEDTLGVYAATPASNTSLVVADFDQVNTTQQATPVDISGLTVDVYHDFTLNSTGISNISLTGVSKYSLREGHDVSGNIPATNTQNQLVIYSAESTGTTQDPKLVVTYTLASFSMGQWFPF